VGSELDRLGIVLGAVALIGVLLAVVLGWLVAQTALVPLNALTDTVEDLAGTTDVTRRLSPGGPDELGRLRRTFNRLLEALEFSRRAQVQLVVDASHELRTPLTSLRTNLEVIRRVDELSEADRSVLVDDVLVQLEELTDLVGDLAELARGDQLPVRQEPLRLDLLVRDAVALATTHGRTQGVTFDLVSEECWVAADGDRLSRAVGNLLDNARKWSPPGQVVSVLCRDGEVVVRDRGPGIEPADLPHVFDRFYRAPSARGLPGSGLGLAIVAQVVKAEGGTIAAEADPGGGTRMTLRSPPSSPRSTRPTTRPSTRTKGSCDRGPRGPRSGPVGVDELDPVPEGVVDVVPRAVGLIRVRPQLDPSAAAAAASPARSRTTRAGCALRAGRKSASTPRWTATGPDANQHPPRPAIGSGLGIRTKPRNPA
jgi:two-component system sensor histidine kinase MprB